VIGSRAQILACCAGLGLFAAACVDTQLVASDCQFDSGLCSSELATRIGKFGARKGGPMDNPDAGGDGPSRTGAIARVDLLLVVDRSPSMAEERAAFAEQIAPLLRALLTGDVDGSGQAESLPVADLRVALISSDLGAGTASGNCNREGDAAQPLLVGETAACSAVSDGFVELRGTASVDKAVENAADVLGCWLRAPDAGCRIEQPLAAALQAFERETAAISGPADAGSTPAFMRSDSLLVVLVLSDEDDCSAAEPDLLLTGDASATGCSEGRAPLSPVATLSAALQELRQGAEDLVMLAVFGGVPVERVDLQARRPYALETSAGREAFYTDLLADPAMAIRSSSDLTEADGDHVGLAAACQRAGLVGYPAPRLVRAARAFGAQGVVQSVCDPDAWQLIAHTIGRRLGSPPH
jgi:hypothetical protein